MTIAVIHLAVAEHVHSAVPIDAAGLDQSVLGFAPIGAAIHTQCAAHRAGNATKKREACDGRLLRRSADFDVGCGRAGADATATLDLDFAEVVDFRDAGEANERHGRFSHA